MSQLFRASILSVVMIGFLGASVSAPFSSTGTDDSAYSRLPPGSKQLPRLKGPVGPIPEKIPRVWWADIRIQIPRLKGPIGPIPVRREVCA